MTDLPPQAAPEGWKPVDPAPAPAAPIPTWVKAAAVVVTAVLMALAILVGSSLGRGSQPEAPTETVTPSPSPSVDFAVPIQVGDYVAGEKAESEGPAPLSQRIARANYFDGTDRVVFAMSWPVEDLTAFLSDAGIEAAAERSGQAGVLCGKSIDTDRAACATLEEDTALLLLAVTAIPEDTLAPLLAEFQSAVAR